MADDDNTGNDDQTGKIDPEQFKQLAGVVEGLATGMKGMQDNLSTLTTTLQEHHSKRDEDEDNEPDPDLEGIDLESMNRSDFGKHIVDQVVSRIQKDLLKPMTERVDSVENKGEVARLREEFGKASEKHQDFWDWKDEMRVKAEANPYLSAEELYTLVRNDNSKKVTELDKKYEEEKNSDADGKGKKKGKFGGLTPGGGSRTEKPKTMSQKAASDLAWEETMGELDEGILSDGSN